MPLNELMIKNLLSKRKIWIKNPLTIGILVIIIFPPLGVLWFMGFGWFSIIRRLIKRKPFPKSSATLFFLGIALSATVAYLTIRGLSPLFYIPMPILLLGYYGVYLFVFEEISEVSVSFHSYTVSLIVGGLYIFFFSQVIRLFHIKFAFPFNYLMGRALLGTPYTPRMYGSTFNPNFAAYLILVMIGFVLAYLLQALKEHAYGLIALFVAILAFGWVAILNTGSRSAFIAMLVIFLLWLIRLNWKVAIAAVLIILIRLQWFIRLIPRKGIIDLSYTNRIIIWENSFKIFMSHPIFGVSPAGFSVFYRHLTGKYVPHSHDIFIAFLTEYGLVGEFVFLLFGLVLVSYFLKMILIKTYRRLFLSEVFLFTLPIILFTGLLDHPLFSPQVALPTVILVAFYHRYVLNLRKSDSL